MENRIEVLRYAINEMVGGKGRKEWRFLSLHIYAVAGYAAMLAEKRGLDSELATMAGLLHDVHTIMAGSPEKHAKRGSAMARDVLSGLGIATDEEMETICTAVRNHSKKDKIHDDYSEMIKDADVLDHYFFNTTMPVIEKDEERLGKLLAELGIEGRRPAHP